MQHMNINNPSVQQISELWLQCAHAHLRLVVVSKVASEVVLDDKFWSLLSPLCTFALTLHIYLFVIYLSPSSPHASHFIALCLAGTKC